MSRASDLRDAIVAELKTQRPSDRVSPFWVPDFPREWLDAGPIIGVRAAGREFVVDMGPDVRRVLIEVGVFGLVDVSTEATLSSEANLKANLDAGDTFDGMAEDIATLWTPNGQLANTGMADHWFREITQPAMFDAPLFHETRLWAGVLLLTYEDSNDE